MNTISKISETFVKKPWGWEFTLLESKDVLVSYLNIDPNKSTSLHCHPTKITGYIVLEGEVEVEFLSGFKIFQHGDSVNFRPGLFHRTTAGIDGALILEIETPANKRDLIRLEDSSGRSDSKYETDLCNFSNEMFQNYINLTEKLTIWTDTMQNLRMGRCLVSCFNMSSEEFLNVADDRTVFTVIDRGISIKKSFNSSPGSNLINVGNVTTVKTLKRMLPVLDFEGKFRFLTVVRQDRP